VNTPVPSTAPITEFTLTQLRYFVTAARAGSMTAAANELYVAQSAVSAAIAAVERSLGVQLFIRQRSRGLALTTAGQRLLIEAGSLLVQAAELRESARSIATEPSGPVNFGCFTTVSPFVVPRVLAHCQRRFPHVQVQVQELETRPALDALLNGTLDVSLLYEFDIGDRFECAPVIAMAPYVILPAEHALAAHPGLWIKDLANEPMILLDIPLSREYFRGLLKSAGVDLSVKYRSSNYETVRGLVAEGQGYALLNQRPAFGTTYPGPAVATVALLDDVAPLTLSTVRVADTRPTSSARALMAVCQATIPPLLGPSQRRLHTPA
jgi:DNA-binding transcriptional LysR family regulator